MRWLVFIALAGACAPDLTPTWAADTLTVQPAVGGAGVVGLQTWSLYGPRWDERPLERFYRCAVIVELSLTPCDGECLPCSGCEPAWSAEGAVVDTDCDDVPELPSINALAMGPLPAELAGEARFPDASSASWARYDDGEWTSHGWVVPEGADATRPAFTAWPAFAWPLGGR